MKTTSCGAFRNSGFTLVELIMVIALSSIVAVMISTVMSRPLQGFADQSRRAELTDLAATALNRMARDIRLAVPNSLRTDNGALELLRAPVGGRYRANLADGQYQDPPACAVEPCRIPFAGPLLVNELSLPAEAWMIIYNVGGMGIGDGIWPPLDNASSVITPKATINVDGSDLELALSGFRFRYASPQHRFYIADKVIGYSCQNGRLLRAEFDSLELSYNYANAALVVNSVDCTASRFKYDPGTNTRNGLVSLRLTLRGEAGETITLLQQVHVENAP
ncbi:MAG TPA: type II secretion system protein [Pseudomonas sp.]|nr:type II secretion system protein [Pseudomonas sp.]